MGTTATSASPVGEYEIGIDVQDLSAANYTFSGQTGILTIEPAVLTVTAVTTYSFYGSPLPTLTDAISGFVNGDTTSVVSGQAALATTATSASPVGSYPITINVSGLSAVNYTFEGQDGTFFVEPAVVTVEANNESMTYEGAVPALSYTYSGFENSDTASVVSGQPMLSTLATSTSTAGNYPITVNVADLSASNYVFQGQNGTLTVNPATPVINWSPTVSEIVYGTGLSGAEQNATSPITGKFVYSPAPEAVLGAGPNQMLSVTFTPSDTTDYTDATASVEITVLKADLAVTATNAATTYGGTVPELSDTITGFVNGDSARVVSGQAKLTTTATDTSPVGSYPINVDVADLSAANYVFSGVPGSLTVNPAVLTVAPNNASKTYGAVLPAFGDTITGFLNGDTIAVVSGQAGFTTTATSASPVGTYPLDVNVSGLSAANYTFTAGPAASLHVTPAPLLITAGSAEIVQGHAIPALSVSYSGFVNGDTPSVLTSQPSVTTTATAQSPPGFYPTVASGASAADYTISYAAGTLTITSKSGGVVTTAPPIVESVAITTVKTGKHSKAKAIVLQFSEGLNAADADSRATYALVTIPSKKKQKSKRVALSKAVYSLTATGSTVTLFTKKPLVLSPALQLTVKATGIIDSLGRDLDGNDSGQSGGELRGDACQERRDGRLG